MKAFKQLAIGMALAATFSASALASVTQTAGPVNYDSWGGWHNDLLTQVTFAQNTSHIDALTGSATAFDQGWGGNDPNGNQIYIALFSNSTQLWGDHFAGGTRGPTFQTFDILTQPGQLSALNSALNSIDWSSTPSVTMQLRSSTIGWPGWALHVQNAQFSVTSDVPEPASIALLGLGLAGLAATRRKAAKK